MDILRRIYQLHDLLRSRRLPVPLATIRETLDCSRATVNRVIKEMRLFLDAPILYDRERNGYHYAEDSYELPGLWFSAEEIQALLAVQQMLANAGPGLLEQELTKLRARLERILQAGHGNGEIHRIRILPMAARAPQGESFRIVAGAVLQRRRLHIAYRGRGSDVETRREISPQRLTHYRDNWYLDAWCHQRQALRSFAVDRILDATLLDTPADNLSDAALDAHFADGYGIFAGEAKHTAILRFTPERARWVADERWHPRQQGQWLESGEYQLAIPYADPRELVMDILRHVPEVEVVAPEELRQEVRERLKAALDRF